MAEPLQDYLFVAVLRAPHGVKGELKVKLLSDLPDRLAGLAEVFLFAPDEKTLLGKRHILNLRGADHSIIKLEGIRDRSAAEKLRGVFLAVPREEAYPLKKDQYFLADLLNMKVYDKLRGLIGTLKDAAENPSQDILFIARKGKKDLLLPFTKENVLSVDFSKGIIKVDLPEGLWEIYD